MKRVVITGIGALTPIGNNLNEFWTNLKNGVSGAGPITKFDTEKFKVKFACELKGYDPKDHFEMANSIKKMLLKNNLEIYKSSKVESRNVFLETFENSINKIIPVRKTW